MHARVPEQAPIEDEPSKLSRSYLWVFFQLVLTHIRHHFKAVYDLTIFYEPFGMQKGSGTRAPPPDLFGEDMFIIQLLTFDP